MRRNGSLGRLNRRGKLGFGGQFRLGFRNRTGFWWSFTWNVRASTAAAAAPAAPAAFTSLLSSLSSFSLPWNSRGFWSG